MKASRNGFLDIVDRLLDCKEIDVNLQDSSVRGECGFVLQSQIRSMFLGVVFFFLICY